MLEYSSIEELVKAAEDKGCKISEVVLADEAKQMEESEEAIYKRMAESFRVMREAVRKGTDKDLRSTSGLTGGDAYKMKSYREKTGGGLMGDFMTGAISRAIAVSEYNAAMGRIVATPTAGSCGIMPGCLVSLYEEKGADERDVVMSMFTAAAFGMVIARNACIAGAQGGCQAECGSASGMSAAALTELMGGSPKQCGDALAIAIQNQMGLVCDPVAGLVEIPCIKRNASGCMIAFSAADMCLAGMVSEIPPDEVIIAMRNVGEALPTSLRETALGGLAATPTAIKLKEKVFGKENNRE